MASSDLIMQKLLVPFTDAVQSVFKTLTNQPNNIPVLFGMFLPNHSDTLTLMVV